MFTYPLRIRTVSLQYLKLARTPDHPCILVLPLYSLTLQFLSRLLRCSLLERKTKVRMRNDTTLIGQIAMDYLGPYFSIEKGRSVVFYFTDKYHFRDFSKNFYNIFNYIIYLLFFHPFLMFRTRNMLIKILYPNLSDIL